MATSAATMPPAPNWWAVPAPVLASIFRQVLENYDNVEEITQQWASLATVSRAWLRAARLTPLCLSLAEPTHLSDPRVRKWMSKTTLEVLIIDRNAAAEHLMVAGAGETCFDCDLLSLPETIANSGTSLVAMINASLGAAPLLYPFQNLRQLSLFSPVLPAPVGPQTVDIAAFAPLTQLTCLTLAGHMAAPDCSALPASLKHFSVSLYHRHDLNEGLFFSGEAQTVALPAHLTELEFLRLKANYLVVPWEDVLARCRHIELSANYLGMTTADGALHDPEQFVEALLASKTPECAVLAFHRLGLFPPAVPPPASLRPTDGDVDLNNFLTVVRERMLATWDMDPVMDAPPSYVNDTAPFDECFSLTLERQEPGQPRSYHFTTPLSDAEVSILKQQPAWRLEWCHDPRTAQVLADPQFVAANAPYLSRLSRCVLPEGVDLRAFKALRSLHGELVGSVTSLRFPPGLTSLELEVPQNAAWAVINDEPDGLLLFERRRFSARDLAPLHALRDLALIGWHRHDLSHLAPTVTSLRVVNPLMENPEGFVESLREYALRLPTALMPPSSAAALVAQRTLRAGLSGSAEERVALEGAAAQAPVWSDSEDETQAVLEAAFSAVVTLDTTTTGSPEDSDDLLQQEQEQQRRRRRRKPHHDNDLDALAHLYVTTEHDDGLFGSSLGDESHPPCTDPTCPVHSGKPHLQLTFTDSRTDIPIDLLYLVASGYPMVTVTVDPTPEAVHAGVNLYLGVGPSWPVFVQELKNSKIEVLEINHRQNGALWVANAGAPCHRSLWEGLQTLQAELGGLYSFRTWDGEATRPGLTPLGMGYALVRTQQQGNETRAL